MTNTLYLPELREMLAENNVAEMQRVFASPCIRHARPNSWKG